MDANRESHSVVKYNFRNLTGDLDGVIAATGLAPLKPSFVQKRARELWDAMKTAGLLNMREWWEQGGMESSFTLRKLPM